VGVVGPTGADASVIAVPQVGSPDPFKPVKRLLGDGLYTGDNSNRAQITVGFKARRGRERGRSGAESNAA